MTRSMFKHLAAMHRETMRYLEDTYGPPEECRKFPKAYIHCLESKVAYHTYMGLHWDYQQGKQGVKVQVAIRNSRRHHNMRDRTLEELKAYHKSQGV